MFYVFLFFQEVGDCKDYFALDISRILEKGQTDYLGFNEKFCF